MEECETSQMSAVHRPTNIKETRPKFPSHASFSFLTNEFTLERVSMNFDVHQDLAYLITYVFRDFSEIILIECLPVT